MARSLLVNGETDLLMQAVAESDDALVLLTEMGAEGFDDADASLAYTLGTVLNKTPILGDDGRWTV
jgi:hypothetical protein